MKLLAKLLCGMCIISALQSCADPYTPTGEEIPVAPTVKTTDPEDGAADVPVDQVITVTFSEAILSSTITEYTFRVIDGDNEEVPGLRTVSKNGLTVSFTGDNAFAEGMNYTIQITRQITDRDDIPLNVGQQDALYESQFSTITTAPTITSVSIEDGASNIALDLSAVTIVFSEDMDIDTIHEGNIFISDMDGNVTYDKETKTATYTLSGFLEPLTDYKIIVSKDITDLSGTALGSDTVISFSTAAE